MKKILTLSLLVLSGAMVAGTVGAIAGNPSNVNEVKAEGTELSYINKNLTQSDLQLAKVADNRLTLNILVPADSGLDFPTEQLIRYAYNTDDGKDTQHGNCHILELAAEGETAATIKARVYALNMFKDMIVLDGHTLNDKQGSGTDVYRLWEYSEANHGRITLTRNADGSTECAQNRLKVSIDVCLPGFPNDGKEHTIEFKKGMELPSMSYALNKDIGTTTKTTVYKLNNTAKFKFTSSSSPTATCISIDNSQEDILVSRVGFGPLSAYSQKVADGRFGFHFAMVSDATKKGTTYFPDVAQYNVHGDHTHGEFNVNNGAMDSLNTWDFIKYNADPTGEGSWVSARDVRTDDRLYTSAHKYFDSHQDFWFDLKLGTSSPDVVGVKLLKGAKFPSQAWLKAASNNDFTKKSYVEVNADYTFIFQKVDGQYVQKDVICENYDDLSAYCVPTEITGLSLHDSGQNNWCYGGFTLTEYDGDKGNFCYNNQSLTASGEYNAWANTYVEGERFVAKTPSGTEVATRIARIYVNNKEVGFPMPLSKTGAGVDTVVIKAGTRFPALSYIAAEKNNADSPLGATKKFYVTTKDVTLVKVADGQYQDIEILRAEAVDSLKEAYDYNAYRTAEKASYDAEIIKINAAETKAAVDAALEAAKTAVGALKTDAQYIAEELAAAIKAAKEELDVYVDADDYLENAEALEVAIAAGKETLDEVTDINDVDDTLAAVKLIIDEIETDAEIASGVEALIAAIGEVTLESGDKIEAARVAYEALLDTTKAMVSNAEDLDEAMAVYGLLNYKAEAKAQVNATIDEVIDKYSAAHQADIAEFVEGLMTDIDAAEDTEAVDALIADALEELAKIPTLEQELAAAKEEKIGFLENYLDETLYTYTINSTYKTALNNAKKKINNVKKIEDLEAAFEEAKALLDAVPTDAAIDEARTAAIAEIDAAWAEINPELYTASYAEMEEQYAYYKERVNASVVLSGYGSISGLVTSFKSYLASCETDAELIEIVNAEIVDLPDPDTFEYETCTDEEYYAVYYAWLDYSKLTEELKAQVVDAQKLETCELKIMVYELLNAYWRDSSYNYFGVQTIYDEIYPSYLDADMAGVKAVYDQIMEAIATTTRASDFDAKTMADAFYEAYITFAYSGADYIENSVLAISVKEGVLSADDVALINEFGAKAAFEQAHIEYLLTNIPAWNGYETLEEMMEDLGVTMEDIENFYGPLSLEHFYGEDAMEFFHSITPVVDVMETIDAIGEVELTPESKAKIDAARAAYDALAPEAAAKVGNVEVLVAAEEAYEALVKAAELADAKVAAKADLDAMKAGLDMSKYTAENQEAIEKAVTDGKAAIDAATSVEAVSSAKATAVAAINAVPQITPEPTPDPTPAKKGCGGSVIAASGIVTLVTLLGAGLICAKRKED